VVVAVARNVEEIPLASSQEPRMSNEVGAAGEDEDEDKDRDATTSRFTFPRGEKPTSRSGTVKFLTGCCFWWLKLVSESEPVK
jgi:hypothetical protein